MSKVVKMDINVTPSAKMELQGSRKKIAPYLHQGYFVSYEKNGYWVLTIPCKVTAALMTEKETLHRSVKKEIINYYGATRISNNIICKFQNEFASGKLEIDIADNVLTVKKCNE